MLLCKKLIEVVFCLLFLFLSNFVINREKDIAFSLSTQLCMYWLFLFLTNPWPFATFPQNFFRNNFCYHHRIFLRGWSWRKFLFFVSVHTFSLALFPHQREAIKSCSQHSSAGRTGHEVSEERSGWRTRATLTLSGTALLGDFDKLQ